MNDVRRQKLLAIQQRENNKVRRPRRTLNGSKSTDFSIPAAKLSLGTHASAASRAEGQQQMKTANSSQSITENKTSPKRQFRGSPFKQMTDRERAKLDEKYESMKLGERLSWELEQLRIKNSQDAARKREQALGIRKMQQKQADEKKGAEKSENEEEKQLAKILGMDPDRGLQQIASLSEPGAPFFSEQYNMVSKFEMEKEKKRILQTRKQVEIALQRRKEELESEEAKKLQAKEAQKLVIETRKQQMQEKLLAKKQHKKEMEAYASLVANNQTLACDRLNAIQRKKAVSRKQYQEGLKMQMKQQKQKKLRERNEELEYERSQIHAKTLSLRLPADIAVDEAIASGSEGRFMRGVWHDAPHSFDHGLGSDFGQGAAEYVPRMGRASNEPISSSISSLDEANDCSGDKVAAALQPPWWVENQRANSMAPRTKWLGVERNKETQDAMTDVQNLVQSSHGRKMMSWYD